MAGVSSRMSCRQLFNPLNTELNTICHLLALLGFHHILHISRIWVKELNILTLALLYIFEVTCFIRKNCQSLEQNSKFHQYNTRKKLDIHVKLQKTEIYKKSVINMGTKLYNNLPKFLIEIDHYKAFKKELKVFILFQSVYSVEEFVFS
jgi:hypothetical protein